MQFNPLNADYLKRKMPRRIFACTGMAAVLLVSACRQDMHNQPKLIPQRGSALFTNNMGALQQVTNTVARGQLQSDRYFYTGLVEGANGEQKEQDLMPYPVTMQILKRGQERFNIYCSPCHSRVGNGLGAIVERGYKPAANFHDQVHLSQPLSHYFYVMTHGHGAMPDYSAQLTPEDRWAVAAYIRVLQRSQMVAAKDLPPGTIARDLKELAQEKHLPAAFAEPWSLPATAIQANQPDKSQGFPALAPAYPSTPDIHVPPSKPGPTK